LKQKDNCIVYLKVKLSKSEKSEKVYKAKEAKLVKDVKKLTRDKTQSTASQTLCVKPEFCKPSNTSPKDR
jgi:hypothetical protein